MIYVTIKKKQVTAAAQMSSKESTSESENPTNILDGAEVDMKWKNLKHAQQRVQFSPIIGLWEFQKFKFNYLENRLMKIRENFATAAACYYITADSYHITF